VCGMSWLNAEQKRNLAKDTQVHVNWKEGLFAAAMGVLVGVAISIDLAHGGLTNVGDGLALIGLSIAGLGSIEVDARVSREKIHKLGESLGNMVNSR
jgi:hypothetical protein